MEPKILYSSTEHAKALRTLSRLMTHEPSPGTPAYKKMELWSLIINDFENRTVEIGLPDPISAIRFRMEQQHLRQRDLVPFIGSRSKVSEVLRGLRPLSIKMIRALHEGLGIPLEVLLQATKESGRHSSKKSDAPKPPQRSTSMRHGHRSIGIHQ